VSPNHIAIHVSSYVDVVDRRSSDLCGSMPIFLQRAIDKVHVQLTDKDCTVDRQSCILQKLMEHTSIPNDFRARLRPFDIEERDASRFIGTFIPDRAVQKRQMLSLGKHSGLDQEDSVDPLRSCGRNCRRQVDLVSAASVCSYKMGYLQSV
jgi:hypothetical protein